MSVDATSVRIETLGPLQVRLGDRAVSLGAAKQRAVFASLAIHAGDAVTVESVIDAVWATNPPSSARHLVHTYVARLRQALEPDVPRRRRIHLIGSAPRGYRLLIDPEQVDVVRFQRLRADAHHHQRATGAQARAFDLLDEAIRLWRDPNLRDLRTLLPYSSEIDSLRQAWIDAVLDYVTLGLQLDRTSAVAPLAERLARAEPLHEDAQANYLLALNRTGRRAVAVEHFQRVRTLLKDDLGVDPGPQLAAAYREVLRSDDHVRDPGRDAALRPRGTIPHSGGNPPLGAGGGPSPEPGRHPRGAGPDPTRNPAPDARWGEGRQDRFVVRDGAGPASAPPGWGVAAALTAPIDPSPWRGHGPTPEKLIHREWELESLTNRLTMHRLVTVAGPPGCGKSALALHLAARQRDSYPAGVLSADCSDLTNVTELRLRLTAMLAGLHAGDDVTAAVGSQRMLIVLDNAEHIVDPCAALVDEIVRACRQVSVLVSSREPLGLPDEAVWRLLPFEVPGPSKARAGRNPAVELFVRRASQVRSDFKLTPGNADKVGLVCRRLDGLPLALEIAAACLAVDDLKGLVSRLDRPLRDIQPLRRGRPAHHQSLCQTFRHSVECLTKPERWCLARLSRLPQHFRLSEAQQQFRSDELVDVQAILGQLVHKSLLFVDHQPEGPSYRMLNLVHHAALDLAACNDHA
jgi:predicted ATPase/DNA-binding SARP family transcriptional activator